jgi:Bacterial PH domain
MEEGRKACPACGEAIMAAANKCRFCNTDIETYVAARETAVEKTLFHGHPRVIYTFGQYIFIVCTFGIALFFYWLRSISTTFTITTQRVRLEKGIFSKAQDNLEIFRVDHFDRIKPLGERLLGNCTIHLHSSDPGMRSVFLYGIEGLDHMADQLRECSLRERARRRVLPVEQM